MKKNIDKIAGIICLVPFLLVGSIQAHECDECPRNIDVGSRTLPAEEREAVAFDREHPSEDENSSDEAEPQLLAKGGLFKKFYQLHYAAFHRPFSVAFDGSSVELEDGSIWAVKYAIDTLEAQMWSKRDSLVVEQWDYLGLEYKVINQTRDTYVIATPILGPLYTGIHTHWITSIDSFGTIRLEDGSEWDTFSKSEIALWQPNDTVVLGAYRGGSTYNTILININLLNFARTKLNWKR